MFKYSVLMSLYIKEKQEYLIAAIESIIHQTVAPDEIVIVIDGNLTKELNDTILRYKSDYPDLFNIVVSEQNVGLGNALNIGLKHCKNELIARMDTDDIAKLDRCEKQLAIFQQNPDLDIVGSAIDEFYDTPDNIVSRRVVPTKYEDIYKFAKRRSAFNHPTVMYKKSKVLACGGYKDLRRSQDMDLFGRMLFNKCLAQNTEDSFLYYRANESSIKRQNSWETVKNHIKIVNDFRKMGYASYLDLLAVAFSRIIVFFIPTKMQKWVYRKFLRK